MSRLEKGRNLPAYQRGHALALKLSNAFRDRPWPEALAPLRTQLISAGIRIPALIYAAAGDDFQGFARLTLHRALAYTADFQSLIKQAVDLNLISQREYADWDGDTEFIDAELTAIALRPFQKDVPEGAEWDEDDLTWDT